MKVFAISDLHLSLSTPKPMDIFGLHWEDHWGKIRQDWLSRVTEEDLVIIGGDISWAMYLEDARADLGAVMELPGKKILLRGNHDYWWSSLNKIMAVLDDRTMILQNNALRVPGLVVAGTRGWSIVSENADPQEVKIYHREAQRLALSLKAAQALRQEGDRLLVQFHYPPFVDRGTPTLFTEQLDEADVDRVLFGHLHQVKPEDVPEGHVRGIEYSLVSCDYLGFSLKEIYEL